LSGKEGGGRREREREKEREKKKGGGVEKDKIQKDKIEKGKVEKDRVEKDKIGIHFKAGWVLRFVLPITLPVFSERRRHSNLSSSLAFDTPARRLNSHGCDGGGFIQAEIGEEERKEGWEEWVNEKMSERSDGRGQ
jgi:hypothetical protein